MYVLNVHLSSWPATLVVHLRSWLKVLGVHLRSWLNALGTHMCNRLYAFDLISERGHPTERRMKIRQRL